MFKELNVGEIIGIYEVLGKSDSVTKDGHKLVRVKCTVCSIEKDIRPVNLGATVCNHKQKIVPRYCKFCGKLIPYDSKTKSANYKLRQFCSRSCAASVNSKRTHSIESKLKASKTALTNHYGDNSELYKAKLRVKPLQNSSASLIKNASKYYEDGMCEGKDYVLCPYCGVRFSQIQASHLRLHNKSLVNLHTEFGLDYQTVSIETSVKKAKASRDVQQKLVDAGLHKGWQSRKITSYAEQYWINVLDAHNITYEREFPIKRGNSNYFLDFRLEHNGKLIDLEIDGKQHQYEDRAKLDVFVRSAGYLVYRIPWNNINTVNGRQLMQDKINAFLEFYNSL